MEGRRVRDRVHAVERMRDVDDASLRLDRVDRLSEAHPARDLLVQEEADHLALPVGLHLFAGDHDDVAVTCELGDLESAGEDVVVGDRDRAEPLRLRVVEQERGRDAAVVRGARVHVEVDDDPVPIRERVGVALRRAPAAAQALVDVVELQRHVGEGLAFRGRARFARTLLAIRVVLGEASHLGGRQLRLLVRSGRSRDGGAGRSRLEREPRQAVRRRNEDRRVVENRRATRRISCAPHVDPVDERPRDVGPRRQRLRPQEREPPVRKLPERVERRLEQRPLGLAPLEHDQPLLAHRLEERRVDALRHERVVAGETQPPPRQPSPATWPAGRRSCPAASRAARAPADTRGARARETSRPSGSRPGEARGTRGSAARARTRGRRRSVRCRARARGSSARRAARPSGCAARSARPGRAPRARFPRATR